MNRDKKTEYERALLMRGGDMSALERAVDESLIIAITDQRGVICEVNDQFCELSKYTREELLGRDHRILNSGHHPASFFREMWRTIGSGKKWRGEILNRAKDGSLYWVNTTIVPVLNEAGKPYRYISIRVEITEQKKIEEALQKALKDDFKQTVKNLENGIFKMSSDGEGRFIYTMGEGKLMEELGLNTEQISNRTPSDVFPPAIALYKEEEYKKAFEGKRVSYEFSLAGKRIYVDVSPVKTRGKVVELVGSVHDMTDYRFAQRQLAENQLLYETLFKLSQEAVFTLDIEGNLLTLNPVAETLFGYAIQNRNRMATDYIVDSYQKQTRRSFRKAVQGEIQNVDTAVFTEDGEEAHLNVTLLPIMIDQEVTGIYAVGKDITEMKRTQELNAYLAEHDELTKLLNRRGFELSLKHALSKSKKSGQGLAILYIDLDRFKKVNDTLGHYIGDRLLEQIAFRLEHFSRKGSRIARMGGDEFMVLCPLGKENGIAETLAKDLLNCLKEPFFIEGYELYVTASIGLSFYPEHGNTVVELMKHADVALYRAKDEGRNHFQVYHSAMDEKNYHAFFMERDLRKALKQEEFLLHFQPRFDAAANRIVGAEALIRWNHPEYGLISPLEFIPLAEETGMILPIGKWVKERVCRQLAEWRDAGFPLIPVSINISAQAFLKDDLADCFSKLLEKYRLDGSLIEIEITENSLIRNEKYVKDTIAALKKLGIRIYIDDFGTGYSSFAYLKSYNLDGLKIDKTFIRNISKTSENAGITSAMIKMGQLLQLDIVAEGVETLEEVEFLAEHQCHHVQGFYFGKPADARDFEHFFLQPQPGINSEHH